MLFPEELRCQMEEYLSISDEGGISVPAVHHDQEGNGQINGLAINGMDSLNTGQLLMERFCAKNNDNDFI